MSDREEIIQILNPYAPAVETQRWDLFDRIFTEDIAVLRTEAGQGRISFLKAL